jgi:hypothetical protein
MTREKRMKIGLIDTEPTNIRHAPEGLTPPQQALREAVINKFTTNRINKYIKEQMAHINFRQTIADGIRLLFDEHGRPPANAPLEDIIAERKNIEAQILMLEAICAALRNRFMKVKEIEDMALELLGHDQGKD